MASRYEITDIALERRGTLVGPAAGANATVTDLAGNNLTIYTTETGATTASNPIEVDVNGNIAGWVDAPDFDVSFSGGVASDDINVRQSPPGDYAVESYGAVPGGTVDATAAFQAARAAAGSTGTVRAGPSDFKITGKISTGSTPLRFKGSGIGATRLLHYADALHMFECGGSIGSTVAITAGSALGATSLTVTSTTGLAAGDFLVVRDTTQIIYGNSGKTAAGVAGEIARIKSVDSGTVISLYGRLDYAYTTSGDIRKLTLVDGFYLSDCSVVNPNPGTMTAGSRAVALQYVRGATIINVDFKDLDDDAIRMDTCIDFDVTGFRFRDLRDTETSGTPYGVNCLNACSDGSVSRGFQRYGRHLFTAGGGTTTEPQPAKIDVSDCRSYESSAACFDCHPGSRWITFHDCHAHNSKEQGFQIRGVDCSVIDPVISQCTNGISFVYGADRGIVRGAKISGCDYGFNLDSANDVTIKGAQIENPVTAGFYIKESAAWSGTVLKLLLDDIKVTGNPTDAFKFDIWSDSFDLKRLDAPDATNKITSVSVNTPKIYGLYHDGFPGLIAPTSFTDSIASVTQTANLAVLVRFVPQRNMTITKLRFVVTTASGADDAVDVGIYGPNSSANVLTRLVSSGATTGKLNSQGPKEITVSATKLVAGTVYFAAMSWGTLGGTAAVLAAAGTNNTFANQLMSSTDVFYEFALSKATSHPLPSTISGPSNIANAVKMGVME